MYLKIFGIILSFYITYPAIIFTNYVMLLYIFLCLCVRHIKIHGNVLTLDTLVKVCIIRMKLKENVLKINSLLLYIAKLYYKDET